MARPGDAHRPRRDLLGLWEVRQQAEIQAVRGRSDLIGIKALEERPSDH